MRKGLPPDPLSQSFLRFFGCASKGCFSKACLISCILACLLACNVAVPAQAAEKNAPSCTAAAKDWTARVKECDVSLLQKYAQMSCVNGRKRVAEYRGVEDAERRGNMCRFRVLLWAHTEACLYFRDVVCPKAWEPCRQWSQELYERCMAGDGEWFE